MSEETKVKLTEKITGIIASANIRAKKNEKKMQSRHENKIRALEEGSTAIYQLKLKGNHDYVDGYHTFLAQDVEDAIEQVGEEEIEKIERVNLLACGKDIDEIVLKLQIQLVELFEDLITLVREQGYDSWRELPDFVDLGLTVTLIKERTQQVESIISALHMITSDCPIDFGYEEKEAN